MYTCITLSSFWSHIFFVKFALLCSIAALLSNYLQEPENQITEPVENRTPQGIYICWY